MDDLDDLDAEYDDGGGGGSGAFSGLSGAGKSSLLNAVIPGVNLRIGSLSGSTARRTSASSRLST